MGKSKGLTLQRHHVMLPPGLSDQIKDLAKLKRRTFTAQLQIIVERGLAATEQGNQPVDAE